jgi:Protein of unknown function (DUF2844)
MKRKSKSSFTIWAPLTVAIAFAVIADPRPLSASLGGDVTSVEADRAKMQASVQTTSKEGYEIHEMHATNNVVVREFVASSGKVFGVAWQGPIRPDLQQLLGSYFDTFTQAAQKAHKAGRRQLLVTQPGLVVQMGGHARAFVGRAYVPEMIPAGVRSEEIQ